MPVFNINVDFEVFCSCGEGLCNSCTVGTTTRRGMPYIEVEPCQKCLDKQYELGVEEGSKDM